jgi:hypothetical protein
MAKAAPKLDEADVSRLVHAAVLKLARSEAGPLKVQSKKGEDDGLFPAGTTAAIKAAIQQATTGDDPPFRSAGKQGKTEVFELTPAGVAAIGPAVAQAAEAMPAAEAVRLAERVMEKRPETVVELEPLLAKLAERQRVEAEREAKQRLADAERQQRVLEAMTRYQAGIEQRRQARIAELKRELAEYGESSAAAGPSPKPAPVPAPKDAKEFIRQEARRLVSAWADAVRLGKAEAQLALEVVLGNLSAVEQIGEEGEETTFQPVHHECDTAASSGAAVVVQRPGWRLIEDGGTEYVVAKAKVKPR